MDLAEYTSRFEYHTAYNVTKLAGHPNAMEALADLNKSLGRHLVLDLPSKEGEVVRYQVPGVGAMLKITAVRRADTSDTVCLVELE